LLRAGGERGHDDLVERQGEGQQRTGEQRGAQHREGDEPERREDRRAEIHRSLLELGPRPAEPGDDVIDDRHDAERGVRHHDGDEAELPAEQGAERVVEGDARHDPRERDRQDHQQRHGVAPVEAEALQGERHHRPQHESDPGGGQADPPDGAEVGQHHDDGHGRHRGGEREVVRGPDVVVDDVAEELVGPADDADRDVVPSVSEKVKIEPATTAGNTIGSTTRRTVPADFEPRSADASSNESGNRSSPA
jgi:hypothetical protein